MKRRYSVRPPRPYSLALTMRRLFRFDERVHVRDGERYARALFPGRSALLVTVAQQGPPSRAELRVTLEGRDAGSAAVRAAADQLLERVLGARTPVAGFYRDLGGDPMLAGPIRQFRGLRVAGFYDLFEALVTALFSQQVNLAFAYSIRRDLAERYGRRARFGGRSYLAFPAPKRVAAASVAELRDLRLSGAKAETLARLAEGFASGRLGDAELAALPDEEVIARLVAIKGIGRWTADTALIRGLQRRDAFPAGDLGVVKVLASELLGRRRVQSEAAMRRFSERWRPHRALALIYAYEELARRRSSDQRS